MNRDGETVELLQALIRNRCVNTNAVESGQEHRSVSVLQSYLEGAGLDISTYESAPGRSSLVARIAGTDPAAPSLLLLGHTDVVPATEDRWQHDPFGAELIDGWIWGRGAIDMLNLTSTMAVAMRSLAEGGFRPQGDLIYAAVADEESGGTLGSKWLLDHHYDDVKADNLVTEWGGVPIDSPSGSKLWIAVGQKGGIDCTLTVRGTPGHASMPYGSDNALIKAAHVVERIANYKLAPEITDIWRHQVEAMGYDAELTAMLLDPSRVDEALGHLSPGMAKRMHACSRLTAVPSMIHGGVKSNVIPDRVDINVLMRRLPSQSYDSVMNTLHDMLGDLADEVEIAVRMNTDATASPVDTPLWSSLQNVSSKLMPGAQCVPTMTAGGNDAPYWRRHGTVAYGYGLVSNQVSLEQFFSMFHGDNERIDLESLRLSRQLWEELAKDFLAKDNLS